MTDFDFPFGFDGRGRTAEPDSYDEHVRNMLERILFTEPGERVNRPDFGSGLLQVLFAPNSMELAATVQYTTQSAVQRWLGDIVELHDLQVHVEDSTLRVDLVYTVKATGDQALATFVREVSS